MFNSGKNSLFAKPKPKQQLAPNQQAHLLLLQQQQLQQPRSDTEDLVQAAEGDIVQGIRFGPSPAAVNNNNANNNNNNNLVGAVHVHDPQQQQQQHPLHYNQFSDSPAELPTRRSREFGSGVAGNILAPASAYFGNNNNNVMLSAGGQNNIDNNNNFNDQLLYPTHQVSAASRRRTSSGSGASGIVGDPENAAALEFQLTAGPKRASRGQQQLNMGAPETASNSKSEASGLDRVQRRVEFVLPGEEEDHELKHDNKNSNNDSTTLVGAASPGITAAAAAAAATQTPSTVSAATRSVCAPFTHFKDVDSVARALMFIPAPLLYTPCAIDVASGNDAWLHLAAQRSTSSAAREQFPFQVSVADSLLSSIVGPNLASTSPARQRMIMNQRYAADAVAGGSKLQQQHQTRPVVNVVIVGFFTDSPFHTVQMNRAGSASMIWTQMFLESLTEEIRQIAAKATGKVVGEAITPEVLNNEVVFRVVDSEKLDTHDRRREALREYLLEAAKKLKMHATTSKNSGNNNNSIPASRTMLIVVKDNTFPNFNRWHAMYHEVLKDFTKIVDNTGSNQAAMGAASSGVVAGQRSAAAPASTSAATPDVLLSKVAIVLHLQPEVKVKSLEAKAETQLFVPLEHLPAHQWNRLIRVEGTLSYPKSILTTVTQQQQQSKRV